VGIEFLASGGGTFDYWIDDIGFYRERTVRVATPQRGALPRSAPLS
jgi:hypothetical protein